MAGERWADEGGRHVFRGPVILTPCGATRVGVKKRRKKPDGCKCGMKRSTGGPPRHAGDSGSDLAGGRNGLKSIKPWSHSTSVRGTVVEDSIPTAACCDARLDICDHKVDCDNSDYHSNSRTTAGEAADNGRAHPAFPGGGRAGRGADTVGPTPSASSPKCGFLKLAGKREFFFSFICYWLVGHAVLASYGAAAAPSPSHVLSTSSSSTGRYRLVPPDLNNDTIFIFLNPSSIDNLRVNTRQFVHFNFTLHTRQNRLGLAKGGSDPRSNTATTTTAAAAPNNDNQVDSLVTFAEVGDSTGSVTSRLPANGSSNSSPIPPDAQTTAWTSIGPHSSSSNNNGSRTADRKPYQLSNAPNYWVMIYSDDDSIARPLPNGWAAGHVDARGTYILMAVTAGRQHNFSVEARHIGRVTMSVAVVGDKGIPQASYVQAVAATQYQVTTVRGERTADIVFNSAAAAIAIIISFGIGAITDLESLKRQLKYPVALIIGFCCQFIIMPVLAFGLAMLLPLQRDISFGLLCVACVPGGGLSHVAVIIADGDTALSLTMNMITVVAMLGTAPLWLFVLGQYFQTNSDDMLNPKMLPIYYFEVWLAATFFAYAFGLIIKRVRPAVADAILMWLIKPFLLLASILYITLGVYINMYVFELVNTYALLGAMLLPLCGFVVGAATAAICRQSLAFVKTIALETSSLNCLVVMVALRFSLKQPDADLAAMIPIWVMFTIPGLFVSLAICNKAKVVVVHYWQNRNNKDNDIHNSSKAYSVSSSVVSPPGTTTLSAPLVTADGLDDDATISTTSNQKVTVL
ncbi:hypothetical protein Btru_062561 [Bulinus truncatus]|nr:hypothetical protein Btru_062561 [Bulinus truncatus]